MIEVTVFDDGVVCSECPFDIAWPNVGNLTPSETATHHLNSHHRDADFSKRTVSGPMPRPITLTRQQIEQALSDGFETYRHEKIHRGLQRALADALVAASETNR